MYFKIREPQLFEAPEDLRTMTCTNEQHQKHSPFHRKS